jgi:Sulfatase-modifying factor enzyme 1
VAGMDTSKFPVEMVNWYESVEFCNKLGEKEGLEPYYALMVTKRIGKDSKQIEEAEVKILGGSGYHLPTEAEWEHGCRAGTKTTYHFGDKEEDLPEYAWFDKNSEKRTHAVGEKKPNAFGLYDMHGNVREWNEDMLTNPKTGAPERVNRGGRWNNTTANCAVSGRTQIGPALRIFNQACGLRVARVAVGNESTPSAFAPLPHRSGWIEEKWLREVAALPAAQQVAAVNDAAAQSRFCGDHQTSGRERRGDGNPIRRLGGAGPVAALGLRRSRDAGLLVQGPLAKPPGGPVAARALTAQTG